MGSLYGWSARLYRFTNRIVRFNDYEVIIHYNALLQRSGQALQ